MIKIENLFYLPNIDNGGPRAIRIRNIVRILNTDEKSGSKILKYGLNRSSKEDDIILTSTFIYKMAVKLKLFHLILFINPNFKLIGVDSIFNKINRNNILKLIKKLEVKNLIIVVSPFTSLLLIPAIKRINPNVRIVLDIGDPLYKNSARWNDDQKSYLIEKNAVLNIDKIIVTNEMTKQFYISEFNVEEDKIQIIPQGVNLGLLKNSNKQGSDILGSKQKIVYGGRFYDGLRSPENIFKYLANQEKFILDVYGSVKNRNIKNIFCHGKVEQSVLFAKMNKADILLFIDNSNGIQTSGKIYELLAFCKPILFIYANNKSPLYTLVKDYKNVILVENDYNKINESLDNLKLQNLGSVDYDIDSFSWKRRAKDYKSLLTS